jgi:hypothetical protein
MRGSIVCVVIAGCGSTSSSSGVDAPITADARPIDANAVDADLAPQTRLADVVHDAPGASGSGYGDPMRAVDGVRGGGASMGGLDVYSLGYGPGGNESITLAWSAGVAHNGPGDDLAVFENPFASGGGVFMDQVIVEVSRDGTTWRAIAHDYVDADETTYSNDPSVWHGFGGRTPVLLNADTNPVDPFDRVAAGGDGFDLDDVEGNDAEAQAIKTEGVRYVRLVSAPARTNPDTGAPFVHDPIANGADIDGLYGRYVGAP